MNQEINYSALGPIAEAIRSLPKAIQNSGSTHSIEVLDTLVGIAKSHAGWRKENSTNRREYRLDSWSESDFQLHALIALEGIANGLVAHVHAEEAMRGYLLGVEEKEVRLVYGTSSGKDLSWLD